MFPFARRFIPNGAGGVTRVARAPCAAQAIGIAAALALGLIAFSSTLPGHAPRAEEAAAPPPADAPAFSPAFLGDPKVIVHGRQVFFKRCTFCHVPVGHLGGHAPQLRPNALTPDFVFDRVTKGFRLMPAWGPLISEDDRRAVTAFIMSDPRAY